MVCWKVAFEGDANSSIKARGLCKSKQVDRSMYHSVQYVSILRWWMGWWRAEEDDEPEVDEEPNFGTFYCFNLRQRIQSRLLDCYLNIYYASSSAVASSLLWNCFLTTFKKHWFLILDESSIQFKMLYSCSDEVWPPRPFFGCISDVCHWSNNSKY